MSGRGLLLFVVLSACITDQQEQDAVDAYCASAVLKACEPTQVDTGCCPGFACIESFCRRLTPGTCLFPDAGNVNASGVPCGCAADCISKVCTDSKCQ